MKIIGVTGNIGCGKSTVTKMLNKVIERSVILDTDSIAKEVLLNINNRDEIVEILGVEVVDSDDINLKKVSSIIFDNDNIKERLESFIHPLVWVEIQSKIDSCDDVDVFFVESALIYESNMEKFFDEIVVVHCSLKEQIRRLSEYRDMEEDRVIAIMAHQICSVEKVCRASFSINTECSKYELLARVDTLSKKII